MLELRSTDTHKLKGPVSLFYVCVSSGGFLSTCIAMEKTITDQKVDLHGTAWLERFREGRDDVERRYLGDGNSTIIGLRVPRYAVAAYARTCPV